MENTVPRTVEEVFSDFKGRRTGLIKALTADVEKFYQQCDPGGAVRHMVRAFLTVGIILTFDVLLGCYSGLERAYFY